jgi:hypothetical protein
VYDMYPWDAASQGDYPPEPLRSRRDAKPSPRPSPRPGPKPRPESSPRPFQATPARAVQIALDRRDNGGDAAAAQAAVQAAAPAADTPTASLTRQ